MVNLTLTSDQAATLQLLIMEEISVLKEVECDEGFTEEEREDSLIQLADLLILIQNS